MKRSISRENRSDMREKSLKSDKISINTNLLSEDCKYQMKLSWKSSENFSSDACKLLQEPFSHCVIENFLQGGQLVDELQEELRDLDYCRKDNDLYKFHQSTEDLKAADSPLIKNFRQALCTTFRDWLIDVCDTQLNENVSMFSAQYMHTDTLLCHDDELEDRRIAFIYYLVSPSWNIQDGGSLDLFAVDSNIQPTDIVKSISPQRNSLVFFEVSPGSYHQVSEVLSEDKVRWSIGGWFHGPPIERPPPYREPTWTRHTYGSITDEVFFDWINPVYLTPHAQGSIQEQFENDSEIELQDFIQDEKFKSLLKTLQSPEMKWQKRGPANKRCYHSVEQSSLPPLLKECLELFKSDAMFLLLSNLTGLKLHELAGSSSDEESDGECSEEHGTSQTGSSEDKSVNKKSETSLQTGSGETDSERNKLETSQTERTETECEANKQNTIISDDNNEKKSTKDTCEGSNGDSNKSTLEGAPCTAKCHIEVRSWRHGCYTLAHDSDTEGAEFALDLIYYTGCHDWEEDYGGFMTYIAKDEDEELLTVTPKENSLALVYRDKGSQRFVKHLNSNVKKMGNAGFYDISAVYFEK